MDTSMATVAVFKDLTSACFYQSLLEENGLDPFLPDEYKLAIRDPALMVAVGAIRLQVPADQAAEAVTILQDAAEEMAGLSLQPQQLTENTVLPSVASEWRKTWLAIGATSVFGLVFTIFMLPGSGSNHFRHHVQASSWESIFSLARMGFAFFVGLACTFYVLWLLMKPSKNDFQPGSGAVTEDDFVPGPEGEPGERVSFWTYPGFEAIHFLLRWFIFICLSVILLHLIAKYAPIFF
jgi:hypothetical protein